MKGQEDNGKISMAFGHGVHGDGTWVLCDGSWVHGDGAWVHGDGT